MSKPALLRTLPAFGIQRVDKEKNIIHGVSMAQTGPALGHNMEFDAVSIRQAVELSAALPRGVKSRFTHPGLSSDGFGSFLGRVMDPRVEGDKAVGDLHVSDMAFTSPRGDLGTYVLGMAEKEPDTFGMSMVVMLSKTVWVMEDGREILCHDYENRVRGESMKPDGAVNEKFPSARFASVRASDVVDEPAANRDGLFAENHLIRTNLVAEDLFEELDLFLSRTGVDYERAFQFALSYFQARGVGVADMQPKESAEQPEGVYMGDALSQTGQAGNTPADPTANLAAWQGAIAESGTSLILDNSGLPQISKDRLKQTNYESPGKLQAAIEAERQYLASLQAASVVNVPGAPARGGISVGDGPIERFKGAVDWMFGVPGASLPTPEYRKLDLLYVALTGDVDIIGRFDPSRAFAASPVTLPDMAVDAMQKVMIAQFSMLSKWRWYERIVHVVPNDGTLNDPKWITYGGTGNLPIVADGAAYTEAVIGDGKESDPFEKRGVYVGITRKMIKNSEILKMQAIPKALILDAVRTRSAKIAGIFTMNSGVGPTLDDDSTALFHANHSNVATTAFDITAWRAASTECFGHTERGSGKPLGIRPKFALVPDDLYFTALAAFGYGVGMPTTFLPEAVAFGPGDPRPEVIEVPDWTDANDWGYITDPVEHPVIEMTYSAAPGGGTHAMPQLLVASEPLGGLMFTNDQLPIRVMDEWAAGPNSAKGIGKRNV